jgi:hypothetical protein
MRMIGSDAFEFRSLGNVCNRTDECRLRSRFEYPDPGCEVQKWNEPNQNREDSDASLSRMTPVVHTVINTPIPLDRNGHNG